MALKKTSAKMLNQARLVLAFLAMMQFSFLGPLVDSARADDQHTSTPIKHVIIIVGENRTFDHLFATYQPKPGESVKQSSVRGDYHRERRTWRKLRQGNSILHRRYRKHSVPA